ncbi:MAG: sodium:proton antiporter NhaD [Planctomycetota bacterium]|nr:sodium:proton antiporter NhaD [Planctomycetota bacterium]
MLTVIILLFVLGYLAIALEHQIHINKAASAILTGVLCWTLYAIDYQTLVPTQAFEHWHAMHGGAEAEGGLDPKLHFLVDGQLSHLFSETAGILFFLIGAMTIVELVDAHEGFSLITRFVRSKSKVSLLWVIGICTFFLSSVLDNLTTTIVMISVLRKLVADRELRLVYVGIVVIAANAGGAWTVIGDVTTTMIWMKHKISEWEVMRDLFLPSMACLLVPLGILSRQLQGELETPEETQDDLEEKSIETWHKALFLALGVAGLLSVPIFKTYTHLPPFMGMMLSLGVLWLASEFVSHTMDEKTKSSTGVLSALRRIDMSSVLFFLGILLAVGALGSMNVLTQLAEYLQATLKNQSLIAVIIGLVSAVVDNVPLVAAGIEMYASSNPLNDPFWMLLAYCGGTGGSCLIIGSAAGVAAMGLEKIDFFWYFRKIAPLALAGYFAGIAVYFVQHAIF